MDEENKERQEADEALELTEDQVQRLDEIDNAAFEYLKVLTNNPDLEWNMEFIGELNDMAAAFMHGKGFPIYYPAIVDDGEGNQVREDYYSPD